MGRHKRIPLKDGRIVTSSSVGNDPNQVSPSLIAHDVLDRLGHDDIVCVNCNRRHPDNADRCRTCGQTQFRERHASYADE